MRQPKSIVGKTKEEKVRYLNSLLYSTILKQKKNRFYLIIPELSLVAVADDLEEAYEKLSHQKQKLFTRLIDCEAEDAITFPRKIQVAHDTFHQIKVFLYKLIILCTIGGLTLVISGALLTNKIAQLSAIDIIKKQIKSVTAQVDRYIIEAPEKNKEERLKKMQLYIDELRPFVQKAQILFISPVNGGIKDSEK